MPSQPGQPTTHFVTPASYISQFTSDVCLLPGSANNAVDALSCIDVAALSMALPIDLPALAKAQRDEDITTAVMGTYLVLQPVAIPTTDFTPLCDVATGTPHPYVPEKLRQLFTLLHGLSHPGICATQ